MTKQKSSANEAQHIHNSGTEAVETAQAKQAGASFDLILVE